MTSPLSARPTLRAAVFGLSLIFGAAVHHVASPSPALADDGEALATFKVMKPEVALELAKIAMETCREQGYQVAVSVVDRFGIQQVFLRDQFAGPHTIETAYRKAWTAVTFRGATLELSKIVSEGHLMANLTNIPMVLALGGGLPVEAAGSIVGGIGISGAPGPDIDDACAAAAIGQIQPLLEF